MAAAVVASSAPAGCTSRHDKSNAEASGASASKACPLPLDEPVCLRRFGLNFDPPSLVLEYERLTSGRLFHRRIGLRRLGPGADAKRTAEKIKRQNEALLAEDQVPFEQLVSVVARLCESSTAARRAGAAAASEKAKPSAAATATGSDGQKAGGGSSVSTGAAAEGASAPSSPDASASSSSSAAAAEAKPDSSSAGASGAAEVDGELNLNKLSTEELEAYKRKMDVEFFNNQKKPGDDGFVYDVRIDHVVDDDAEDCGWDSDDD